MCFNTSNDEKKDVVYNNENDNTTNRNIENFSKIDKQVINFNDKVMPEDGSEADKSLLDLTVSKKHVTLHEKSRKVKKDEKFSIFNDQVFLKNCQKNTLPSIELQTGFESMLKVTQNNNGKEKSTLNSKTPHNFNYEGENSAKNSSNFVGVDRSNESSVAIEQVNYQYINKKKSAMKTSSNHNDHKEDKEADKLRNCVNNKENYYDENKFQKLKIKVENEENEEATQDIENKELTPKDSIPPVPQLAKLKKFLNTLQQFADDLNSDIGFSVKILIQDLVSSTISVEEFHEKMQKSTNFPLRPFAIPFLKTNLPLLQEELGLCQQSNPSEKLSPTQSTKPNSKKHTTQNSAETNTKPHNVAPIMSYQPENVTSHSNLHSFLPLSQSNQFFSSNKPFSSTSNGLAFSDSPSFLVNFEKFFSKNIFNSHYYSNPYLHYFDDKFSLLAHQHFLDNNVKTDLFRETSPNFDPCLSLLSLKNYGKDSSNEYDEHDLSNNSHSCNYKPKRKLLEENISNTQKKPKTTQFSEKTPKIIYHHKEDNPPMLKNQKTVFMNTEEKDKNAGCSDQKGSARGSNLFTNNELTEELVKIWLRFDQNTTHFENTMNLMVEKCKEHLSSLRLNTQKDIEALLMLVNNNYDNNYYNKNKNCNNLGEILHKNDEMPKKSTDTSKRQNDPNYTNCIQNYEKTMGFIESFRPYFNEKFPKNPKIFEQDAHSTPTILFNSVDHLRKQNPDKVSKQKSHSFDGVFHGSKQELNDKNSEKVGKPFKSYSETNLSYEHTKDNLSNGIRNERFYSCNTTRKNASNFDNVLEKTSQNSCWGCGQKASETCGGCNQARYCNVVCQHGHWYMHYNECKQLQEKNINDTTKEEDSKINYNGSHLGIKNSDFLGVKNNQLGNDLNPANISLTRDKDENAYKKHTQRNSCVKVIKNSVRNQILHNRFRKKLVFYKMKGKSSRCKLYRSHQSKPPFNGFNRPTKNTKLGRKDV